MKKNTVLILTIISSAFLAGCSSYKEMSFSKVGTGLREMLTDVTTPKPDPKAGKPTARELARLEARAKERRDGLPKIHAGMSAHEVGGILPHTFPFGTRHEIKKAAEFTASVDGYKIHFAHGIVTKVEPPATAQVDVTK
jgi:hypothetical protein